MTAKKAANKTASKAQGAKAGRGRPTKYRPEFVRHAEKLAMLGATDQEMADFFEVDQRTFYRWRNEHDDFCQALKQGKEHADTRVERSLFQMATGYEQDEVKIFMPAGSPVPVYAPFRAKIAPNVTAAIFWLKNRQPEQWREKREGDPGDDAPVPVAVTVQVVDGRKDAAAQ